MGRRNKIKALETYDSDAEVEAAPEPKNTVEDNQMTATTRRIQELKRLAAESTSRKRTSSSLSKPKLTKQQRGENFYQFQQRLKAETKSLLIETTQQSTRKKVKQRENNHQKLLRKKEGVSKRRESEENVIESSLIPTDLPLFGEVAHAPPQLPPLKKARLGEGNSKAKNMSTLASSILSGQTSIDVIEQERERAMAAYAKLRASRREKFKK
ncbi:hypothetical protein RCL1_008569 [Eukaryota sp. TZLM3-RCL]